MALPATRTAKLSARRVLHPRVAPLVIAGGLLLLSPLAFTHTAYASHEGGKEAGVFPISLSDLTSATIALEGLVRQVAAQRGNAAPGASIRSSSLGPLTNSAVTYTYQGGGTTTTPTDGNFSGTNFSASLGATAATTPVSNNTDTLVFNGGSSYTATDDFTSAVNLQTLTIGSTGSAVVTIARGTGSANNSLAFSNTTSDAINLNNATAAAIALDMTLSGATTVSGSGSATLSGILSGTVSLTKAGTGTLTLTGANTYTGRTTITGGELSIGLLTNLGNGGNGGITLNGGLLRWTGGSISFSPVTTLGSTAGGGFDVSTAATNLTISRNFGGANGVLTKTGAGTLTLRVFQQYSGATTVNGGTLSLTNSGGTLLNSSSVTINNGGIVSVGAANALFGSAASTSQTVTINSGGTMTTVNGIALSLYNTTLNGGTLASGTGQAGVGTYNLRSGYAISATANSNITATNFVPFSSTSFNVSSGVTLTDSGTIVDDTAGGNTGQVTMTGAGTLTLGGVNTYTGGTTFNAGVLSLGSSGALGTTGTLSFTGGTLQYSAANTTDYSNRFSTAVSQQYSIDTNSQNVTFATALTSSGGSLAKLGTGTLTLTGANTYTGGTTISAGTIQAGNSAAIGNGGLTLSSAGTLDMNGNSVGITSLSGTGGTITDTNATGATLTDTQATNTTYAGTIGGGAGAISLTNAGTGTLTLTGANTYSGGTTISAGTVVASGGTVNAGGVITSGGLGTGAVSVASGATLSVGEAPNTTLSPITTNTLTAASLMLTTGSTTPLLTFNLGASGVSDMLSLTSGGTDLTYSGSGDFYIGFASATGASLSPGTYTLMTFATPEAIGTSGAPDISHFKASPTGNLLDVNSSGPGGGFNYITNAGGQVTGLSYSITGADAMPEPTALLLLVPGALGMLAARRRRVG